jgi:TPR repeat protein
MDNEHIRQQTAFAAAGDPEFQYIVGDWHYNHSPTDVKRAVYWYEKAAGAGHPAAIYNLSAIYGGPSSPHYDPEKGLKWITTAAEAGIAASQNALGEMYDEGKGIAKDHRKAVQWFERAALQSYPSAHFNLGVSHDRHAPEPDYRRAFEHYRKAADLGHAKAVTNLAVMYYKGRGTPKDPEKGLHTLCLAIHMGDFVANRTLGIISLYDVVPPDCMVALHNLTIAQRAGIEIPDFLIRAMESIRMDLPPHTLGEMEQRTAEFYETKRSLHVDFLRRTQLTFTNNAIQAWKTDRTQACPIGKRHPGTGR